MCFAWSLKVVHHLIKLHREGHKIVILGHSLGGGVAALLGVLLKDVRCAEACGFHTPLLLRDGLVIVVILGLAFAKGPVGRYGRLRVTIVQCPEGAVPRLQRVRSRRRGY